ncbi:MAG: prepilin-type N-terminal cleavage/methylation domain-containing protein [Bacteroidales bacterium]|jgi:prepilin-type N-terminal cleavage/methylation domain-containing protein
MKKLKSFTFIELVVVMAISAFVVSIAYTAYQIINFQFINYKTKNESIKELFQMEDVIQNDFENAHKINSAGKDLIFEMKNGMTCRYEFKQDYILRDYRETKDTLKISTDSVEKSFQNIPNNYGIVDELKFKTNVFDEVQRFVFYKKYESDILIEQEKTE